MDLSPDSSPPPPTQSSMEILVLGVWKTIFLQMCSIFTARKRSLRKLCFYTCLSVHRGCGIPACLAGGIPASLIPCRSWTGVGWLGGRVGYFLVSQHALQVSRPTPGEGELDGSGWGVSRLTPGGLQAHTWRSPGPQPGGSPGPHPGGCIQHVLGQTPLADGYCCGWYASYWNAFLSLIIARFREKNSINSSWLSPFN